MQNQVWTKQELTVEINLFKTQFRILVSHFETCYSFYMDFFLFLLYVIVEFVVVVQRCSMTCGERTVMSVINNENSQCHRRMSI